MDRIKKDKLVKEDSGFKERETQLEETPIKE